MRTPAGARRSLGISLKERVSRLPVDARREFLDSLPADVLDEIINDEWWWTARPEQIPPPGNWLIYLVLSGRGWGKALATNTPIPTPSGWTTMLDLRPGDSVISGDGTPTKVNWVSPIQLGNACYHITFSNGASVIADAEHLWLARSRADRQAKNGYRAITTRQMLDAGLNAAEEPNWQIPLVGQLNPGGPDGQKARSIASIDPVPSIPVRCISVDHPSRTFLATHDLLVTHNSRSGSEWIVERTETYPVDTSGAPTERLIIAETIADARNICVGGPSGVLRALHRRGIEYRYIKSPKPQIMFTKSNCLIHVEGADDADVGRGHNAADVWLDEVCIAAGQPVETSRGAIPIEQVRVGDLALTRTGYRRVTRAWKSADDAETVTIKAGDSELTCTGSHPILTGNGWEPAGDIRPGAQVIVAAGGAWQPRRVISSIPGPRSDVYDLTVEDAHEFVASGMVVHNCKWPDPRGSWIEGIMPSLRADIPGDHPRAFITTTPKPMDLIREWASRVDGSVITVQGSTFDNRLNLSSLILTALKETYDGTSIGQQELEGVLLDAAIGKVFSQVDINTARIAKSELPELPMIVVGVDPGATGDEDETGIVIVGRDRNYDQYVLGDETILGVGREAALHCWRIFVQYGARKLVVENTMGKRWVTESFTSAYEELCEQGLFPARSAPPIAMIDSKLSKKTRAEPVGMRCEQRRIHFVGKLPKLENQCVEFDPSDRDSPDRLDAFVSASRWIMKQEPRRATIITPVSMGEASRISTGGITTLQQLQAQLVRW